VIRIWRLLPAAALLVLPACGGGGITNGTSVLPGQTQVPLSGLGKATFAVGTARLQDGSTGLNVVAYLRKTDGSTAYLVSTPSITGPSGFTVPTNAVLTANGAGGSGGDGGTATISGTAQLASPPPGAAATTFGTAGGLFAGGFGPFNATQNASNFYPGNTNPGAGVPIAFLQPFYAANSGSNAPNDPRAFLLGPPLQGITPFTNVNYPTNFAGYLPGFTSFEAAPVAGTYKLSVAIPAANAASTSVQATATLTSITPLPAIGAPAFTSDTTGGGSILFTVPADPRITETLVFVHDLTNSAFYTLGPVSGTGAKTVSLPDNIGPCSAPNCGNASMATGDKYEITVTSFDYPDVESVQPINTSQTPNVTGASGQTDVSISPATLGTY
jgi:hypothetical protein